jgi:hypothetical protein
MNLQLRRCEKQLVPPFLHVNIPSFRLGHGQQPFIVGQLEATDGECGYCSIVSNAWKTYKVPFEAFKRADLRVSRRDIHAQCVTIKQIRKSGVTLKSHLYVEVLRISDMTFPAFAFEGTALERDIPRTWDRLLDALTTLNTAGLLPDLTLLSAFSH